MPKPSLLQSVTKLLETPQGVTVPRLARDLDVSRATAYRLVEQLRATFGAALVKDEKTHRYRIDGDQGLQWPGIFMSRGELPLILAMLDWLQNSGEVSFQKLSTGLRTKIEAWIQNADGDLSKWNEIVRILPSHSRQHLPDILPLLCKALFLRRRISFCFNATGDPSRTTRLVSPQTLVYYRDAWYLDAFCHDRESLRTFSLHRISEVTIRDQPAKRISRANLNAYFADSYGIFAGKADKQAEIIFQGKAAEYIAQEIWHPKQTLTHLHDGKVKLSLPYGDERELIRDLLRWCDEIVAIKPSALRTRFLGHLERGVQLLRK